MNIKTIKSKWLMLCALTLSTFIFAADPNWEGDLDTGTEFGATLAAAQVAIDGELKSTGKLGAFIDGTVVGVDTDGGVFFPPTGQYIWEVSLYSSSSSAQEITFAYYDDVNDEVLL